LQSTLSLSQQQQPQQTQWQQLQTPQQQTGNVGERNDSTVLLAGITKCPRCQKNLKRPLAHFNRNEECRSHFTQACREQAQQSREQQNNELLQSWIDISPSVGSGHSSKNGFATVTAQNSDGLTVSRRTSTRSVASRRSNKKRRQIGGSPRRAARPSYDADDESEDSSSSSSSISTLSLPPSPARGASHNHSSNDPLLDNASMLNGNPGLSTTEAEQAEGGSIGASSSQGAKPALGTSYNQPAQEAFANLPHLSPVLAALVELYDMLRNSDAPLWLFDKVVAFIEKHNGRTFCRHKTIPRWEALLKELHWSFPVPRAKGIPVAMETGNEALAPEGYERLPRHSVVVQRWPILSVLQEYLLDLRVSPCSRAVPRQNWKDCSSGVIER
jgi:hypothetical protein